MLEHSTLVSIFFCNFAHYFLLNNFINVKKESMKKIIYTIILVAAFQFAQGQVQVISMVSFNPETRDTANLDGATVSMPTSGGDFDMTIAVMFKNNGAESIKIGDTVSIRVSFNENIDVVFFGVMLAEVKTGDIEGISYAIPISRSDVRAGIRANIFCSEVVYVSGMPISETPKCVSFTLIEGSNMITGFDLKEVNIYPNPVRDNLKIENLGDATDINIYNTMGQIVHTVSSAIGSAEIDISSLSAGVYILKMQNSHNIHTKKIQIVK